MRLHLVASVLSAALVAAPAAYAQNAAAQAAYAEGQKLSQAKDTRGAAAAFERATQADPAYAPAWSELGNARLALGQTAAAIPAFQQALALAPADATTRYNLAYALRQQGRFEAAAKEYQTYLESKPNDADAYYGLAESLKAAGQYGAAADAFDAYARTETRATWQKWVKKAKEEAQALRAKAQTAASPAVTAAAAKQPAPATPGPKAAPPAPQAQPAAKQDKLHLSFSGADDAASETIRAAPTGGRPEAYTAGLEQLRASDYAGALVRLKVAMREAPDDGMVMAAAAGAHLGLRQAAEAEALYRRALIQTEGPAKPALYLGLGEAQRLQGKREAAAEAYTRAAEHGDATKAVQRLSRERLTLVRGS